MRALLGRLILKCLRAEAVRRRNQPIDLVGFAYCPDLLRLGDR